MKHPIVVVWIVILVLLGAYINIKLDKMAHPDIQLEIQTEESN